MEPCVDQVEAGFAKYLTHSNGNPLVYDKVNTASQTCDATVPPPPNPPLVRFSCARK